jgi:peptidoglycan/LPS O-acetylase OafA/YrhL
MSLAYGDESDLPAVGYVDSNLSDGMKRVAQLDGIRGIAILQVLVWHYLASQFIVQSGNVSTYCANVLLFTRSGVSLFFVLSGFLIGGILLDHRQTSNYFRVFYLRRACRILPLYFLMLALFVWFRATSLSTLPHFEWLFGHSFPMLSYATFTQNILMGIRGDFGPHWLGATWSLAIEEQFYLFVPLLIFFVPRRVLLLVLPAAILMAPMLRHFSPGFHAYVNAPWRADTLLSGVYLAVLVRSHSFICAVQQRKRILLVLFVTLLVGVVVITTEAWFAGLYVTGILIAFVDTQPRLVRLLRAPVLVWFGQRSYGIYLFHEAVSGLCHGLLRHSVPQLLTLADGGTALLALLITLALATLSYRYFESPILHWGRGFRYSSTPDTEPSLPLAKEEG